MGTLSLWLLLHAPVQAQAISGEPNQHNAHDLEVRIDRLPDEISANDIEIALEASDNLCKPKQVKLLGLNLPSDVHPATAAFCRFVDQYAGMHQGAIALQLSRRTWTHRKVADQVSDLDTVLGKRYVLLSRWRHYDADVDGYLVVRSVRWVAEEALWDRQTRQVLWHSLRNIYCDDLHEGGRVWGTLVGLRRHFAHWLPAVLTQRVLQRQHSPVPEGRWVPAAETEAWQSPNRAALAFVNTQVGQRYRFAPRGIWFPIRPQSQPRLDPEAYFQGRQLDAQGVPAAGWLTPPIDKNSYALLEVPPGRYVIDPLSPDGGQALPLELKAGELVVIEYTRAAIGPDVPRVADAAALRTTMLRGPHAFLQDQRVRRSPWQVETWFSGH